MPADAWTTHRLLQWTTQHFERKGVDSPRVSAEMLLAHVLGCKRLELYMDTARPASELERAAFRELVERAVAGEPVDYLVGKAPFFSLMFEVSPAVLVPRPSTETLVEHVLQHARRTPGFAAPSICDVGTGSGVIAVTLAKHLPEARVVATDISEDALAVARRNAERHGVAARIDFRKGNLLEPVHGMRFDYLLSNPPYIPDDEWEQVDAVVKDHEPTDALRGGPDGLDLIRPLVAAATGHLNDPAQFALEVAAAHHKQVMQLCRDAGLRNVHVLTDHESLPRVVLGEK